MTTEQPNRPEQPGDVIVSMIGRPLYFAPEFNIGLDEDAPVLAISPINRDLATAFAEGIDNGFTIDGDSVSFLESGTETLYLSLHALIALATFVRNAQHDLGVDLLDPRLAAFCEEHRVTTKLDEER